MKPAASAHGSTLLVLDTNAVLDWLLFNDSGMVKIVDAIQAGAVRWVATDCMRDELQRTLSYPTLVRWRPDGPRVLAAFDHWACLLSEPTRARHGPLMCSDTDDQVFIDLAVEHGARWLITHDRALHKLMRPAARVGVAIVRPRDWVQI